MTGKWIYVWWDGKEDAEGWRVVVLRKNSVGQFVQHEENGKSALPNRLPMYGMREDDKVVRFLEASIPDADFIIRL